MINEQITAYIQHYMEKDKTRSALMLTGAWGTGKSYYIQHELVPALQEKNKKGCITVSLYGLKSLSEISKNIYFELKAKLLNKDTEGAVAGKLFAKTLAKGITSFFGVDLSASDDEMQQLYESIDLTGKLIILEDIERCSLSILELLGYVNNLVEQDGVKVLLVANEDEFIKYETIEVEEENPYSGKKEKKSITRLTENSAKYLKVKEKTVNDTIQFDGDFIKAIQQIIGEYKDATLAKFADAACAKDITDIMFIYGAYNLRSFIYACQKTVDIFEMIPERYLSDDDFIQTIFYSIIIFSLRIKSGTNLSWRNETYYSVELGHESVPLFKFCYDYIVSQKIDLSHIDDAYNAWVEKNTYDKNKSNADTDVSTISNYSIHSEEKVRQAIENIKIRLRNPDDISFYMYGTIAVYILFIKDVLECNVDEIKDLLVENLVGRGDKLELERIFRTVLGDNQKESIKQEYEELRNRMAGALKRNVCNIPNFDYCPEQASEFSDYVHDKRGIFHLNGSFASSLDIERLAEMFLHSTAEQKQDIRAAFLEVYRHANVRETYKDDCQSLAKLQSILTKHLEGDVGDRIQRFQYQLFVDALESILSEFN